MTFVTTRRAKAGNGVGGRKGLRGSILSRLSDNEDNRIVHTVSLEQACRMECVGIRAFSQLQSEGMAYSASQPREKRSAAHTSLIRSGARCAIRFPKRCWDTVTGL